MLRQLLALLASGETHTLDGLALALGLERGQVEEMLERLASLGYVEDLNAVPASSCADGDERACVGCSGCGGRFPGAKNRVWTLSPKGRRHIDSFADA